MVQWTSDGVIDDTPGAPLPGWLVVLLIILMAGVTGVAMGLLMVLPGID